MQHRMLGLRQSNNSETKFVSFFCHHIKLLNAHPPITSVIELFIANPGYALPPFGNYSCLHRNNTATADGLFTLQVPIVSGTKSVMAQNVDQDFLNEMAMKRIFTL